MTAGKILPTVNNSAVFGVSGAQNPNHGIADLPLNTTNGESTETSYGSRVTAWVAGNAAASLTEAIVALEDTFVPNVGWNTDGQHMGWDTDDQRMGWGTNGQHMGWDN